MFLLEILPTTSLTLWFKMMYLLHIEVANAILSLKMSV